MKKVPTQLLEDLENLYKLTNDGGMSKEEFEKSKKEIITALLDSGILNSRHLKSAHELLKQKVLTQVEYEQIKNAILKPENLTPNSKLNREEANSNNGNIKNVFFLILESVVWFICSILKAGFWVINLIFVNILINSFLGRKK